MSVKQTDILRKCWNWQTGMTKDHVVIDRMTIIMLLWNYLITPLYMGYPREAVVEMLLTVRVQVPFSA